MKDKGAPTRAALLAAAVLGTAMALAVTGARASVFDLTWRGRDMEARMRAAAVKVGPLRLQPSLVLANAGMDSNIYYSPTEQIRDFTVTAGPKVEAWLPLWRRLIVYGNGSPQYVYYAKTDQERTWNFYYTVGAALSLRRVFLSFERRYSDARERWNYEIDIRPRRKEGTWVGTFLVQATRRLSFELSLRRTEFDYENQDYDLVNLRERLNRTEKAYGLTAYYQKNARIRFFLSAEQDDYNFEFAEMSLLKDSQSRAGYAGVEFSPTGRVRGRIRLGWKNFDVFNSSGTDFRGLVGDAQISARVAKPLVVRAAYQRDLDFSVWYQSAYFIQNRPSAGLSLYPLRFLRLDYDYSPSRNEYPVAENSGDLKRRDDIFIHQAALYVRLKKNMAIGVMVSRWRRDSNIDAEDDTRYFYGMNLVYDF